VSAWAERTVDGRVDEERRARSFVDVELIQLEVPREVQYELVVGGKLAQVAGPSVILHVHDTNTGAKCTAYVLPHGHLLLPCVQHWLDPAHNRMFSICTNGRENMLLDRQGRRGVREEGRTGIEGWKRKVSVGGLLHRFGIN
jgi:hypothetical protein